MRPSRVPRRGVECTLNVGRRLVEIGVLVLLRLLRGCWRAGAFKIRREVGVDGEKMAASRGDCKAASTHEGARSETFGGRSDAGV